MGKKIDVWNGQVLGQLNHLHRCVTVYYKKLFATVHILLAVFHNCPHSVTSRSDPKILRTECFVENAELNLFSLFP